MPARKLNDGTWIVDVCIDIPGKGRERIRKVSPIQTKKGSEEYERQLVAHALSPSTKKIEREVKDVAIEFLDNHVRVNAKYSTLVTYESALNQHIVPQFQDRCIHEIAERDVAELEAKLGKGGLMKKTIRNVLTVLSSMLNIAKEWGYVERVPNIRLPKAERETFRFLTIEECKQFDEGITKYWMLMIVVARKTGLRIGELRALAWEQINFSAGTILVDRAIWRGKVSSPKGNRSRIVDLSPRTLKLLEEERADATSKLVFPNTRGTMRSGSKSDLGLRRCAVRAGLDPFGWHVLRHTYASHLVMKGVPLPVVQQLLGHTDIRLTMRYSHLAPGMKQSAVSKLDEDQPRQQFGRTPSRPGAEMELTD